MTGSSNDDDAAALVEAAQGDVDDATAEVRAAEIAVEAAAVEVEHCRKELDEARAHLELVQQWQARLEASFSSLYDHCIALRQSTMIAWDGARAFIAEKLQHLEAYTSETMPAAMASPAPLIPAGWSASSWINGDGLPDRDFNPRDLKSRFDLNPAQLAEVTRWMAKSDPEFPREIERMQSVFRSNPGTADRERTFLQTKIRTAGMWGEAFAKHALSPMCGSVETQRRTTTEAGAVTITDVVLRDLKANWLIGRGPTGYAKKGSDVGLEFKLGQDGYIYSQKDHLKTQVGGHAKEGASLVIVSRDIHDLPREKSRELRDTMYQNRSYVLALLPRKEQIDQLCWDLVQEPPNED